jgi:transcriptional regulator with XRE-family HTH domain
MPPSKNVNAVAARTGRAIRARRAAMGRTLTDLAAACECSPGFLSQIESGQANPTLQVLHRIAVALETPLAAFFPGAAADFPEAAAEPFTPAVRRRPPSMPPRDGRVREYSAVDAARLRAAMIDGTPPDHGAPIEHPGEEMCLVLSGRYHLIVGESEEILSEGDFAHYPAGRPHALTATAPGSTALLVLG